MGIGMIGYGENEHGRAVAYRPFAALLHSENGSAIIVWFA